MISACRPKLALENNEWNIPKNPHATTGIPSPVPSRPRWPIMDPGGAILPTAFSRTVRAGADAEVRLDGPVIAFAKNPRHGNTSDPIEVLDLFLTSDLM